jgi:hypothetical protein
MTDSRALPPPSAGGARLVEPSLFRLLIDVEMRKAQRLRYCVSVLCVCAKAVSELSSPSSLLDLFRRHLRATDVVAEWPQDALSVLLIDAESGDIPSVMRRVTADLAEGSWSAGGVSYPKANTPGDDMLSRACRLMERALLDPAKPLYLG